MNSSCPPASPSSLFGSRLSESPDPCVERIAFPALSVAGSLMPHHQMMPLHSLTAVLFVLTSLALPAAANPSHQPFNWTLSLLTCESCHEQKRLLVSNVTASAPSFTTDVANLTGRINLPSYNWGAGQPAATGFYMCPSSARGCHDPTHYYCPSWGCETIAHGWSGAPNKDPYLTLQRNATRWNTITLTVKDPNSDLWLQGRMWGARLYAVGYDYGAVITITKEPIPSRSTPVGPNQILNPPQAQPPPPSRSASPSPSPSTLLATATARPP
nr:MLV-related proviral Env polyprotein-like [Dasypus novemcinctus]